jgi:carbamoyl-phosphate synthase/aspartate carbamoyltransferase
MKNIKSLITTCNMTAAQLQKYIKSAEFFQKSLEMTNNHCLTRHVGRIIGLVFYEPSTRTMASFQAAMIKLGGSSIVIQPDMSSIKKGESLTDTIQTMAMYTDVIVLRHFDPFSIILANENSEVPIINGGNGSGEHPTQALLDVYTIYKELRCVRVFVDPITIAFVGDLKYSRTVHSLIHLLRMYDNIKFLLVSPETLELPEEIIGRLNPANYSCMTFREGLEIADVVYMTRIQKERFESMSHYETVRGKFVLDRNTMAFVKPDAIIMHPLPRNEEISVEIDRDPRVAYFKQMKYGVYMRMAILDDILSV